RSRSAPFQLGPRTADDWHTLEPGGDAVSEHPDKGAAGWSPTLALQPDETCLAEVGTLAGRLPPEAGTDFHTAPLATRDRTGRPTSLTACARVNPSPSAQAVSRAPPPRGAGRSARSADPRSAHPRPACRGRVRPARPRRCPWSDTCGPRSPRR